MVAVHMIGVGVALTAVLSGIPTATGHRCDDDLVVKTNHFTIRGAVETNMSNVRVFRKVPYAEPPIGTNRFMPPVTKKPEKDIVDATEYGPSCIQFDNGDPTPYSEYLPGFLIPPEANTSEDCLSLILWAPRAEEGQKLPVVVYLPGGSYTSGGANSPYKRGGPIVRDNQDVIVIDINYRLNIFGYPNAAGLNRHNLNPGLLDQRKAVEWVYWNIAAFGGDPQRITLWGQSAGASSADRYVYSWANDPIVQGIIADSGVAPLLWANSSDTSNFTYVAEQVGCNQTNADEQLSCVQKVNASDIIGVLNTYNSTQNGGRNISFVPAPDNQTSWENYTDLAERGQFARLPMLTGMNDNEFTTLLPPEPSGPNQTLVDELGNKTFSCPGALAAQYRTDHGVPAWRYRYFGKFPNLNVQDWLGAFHSSELPMVFNTSDRNGPNTALQLATIEYIQGAWLAFVRDPQCGLLDYGWPTFNRSSNSLVQLGLDGSSTAVFAPGDKFDDICSSLSY